MTVEHFVAANSLTENWLPQLSFEAVISELFTLFRSILGYTIEMQIFVGKFATLRENDKTFK